MFLTPLPFSEIICFLSMFLTSVYLIAGTLGNISIKKPAEEIGANTITLEKAKPATVSFANYRYLQSTHKSSQTKYIKVFSYSGFSELNTYRLDNLKPKFKQNDFFLSYNPESFSTRGPPICYYS